MVDGGADVVGLGVEVGGVEDVGGVALVVVTPVGDGAQGSTGFVGLGFEEHGHEGHEAAVGPAVDSNAVWVGVVVGDGVVDGVLEIFEFFVAHLSVDGGAPISAIACAGAEIWSDDDEAFVGEDGVEHVFAFVVGPLVVGVLEVACAVDEEDEWAWAGVFFGVGEVEAGVDGLLGVG